MNSISPTELKQKIDRKEPIFLLDVREPFEYDGWHIHGSTNMPMSRTDYFSANLPKNREIIAICAHGMRSSHAAMMLLSMGHKARNLDGGMVAWNSVYDMTELHSGEARVLQLRRIGKGCLSYIVISGNESVIIDPTTNIDVYLEAAKNTKIVGILDTHAHADHVSGGRRLSELAHTSYYAPDEVGKTPHKTLAPGFKIQVGSSTIQVISTPGHTQGSLTFILNNLALTGDTLFVESVGRPDLVQDAKSHAPILWDSLQKLLKLPPETKVLPAHYGSSVVCEHGMPIFATIGQISELQPLSLSKEAFVEWISKNTNPKPHSFELIKQINTGFMGIPFGDDLQELEAGPNRCAVESKA